MSEATLRDKADRAYCDYIDQLRRPECLGWEAKLKTGEFGKAELDAHVRAGELLGRHRALVEAALATPSATQGVAFDAGQFMKQNRNKIHIHVWLHELIEEWISLAYAAAQAATPRDYQCPNCGAPYAETMMKRQAVFAAQAAQVAGTVSAGLSKEQLAVRLDGVTRWLEKNQPDVFRRGLWDAVNEVEPVRQSTPIVQPDTQPTAGSDGLEALRQSGQELSDAYASDGGTKRQKAAWAKFRAALAASRKVTP